MGTRRMSGETVEYYSAEETVDRYEQAADAGLSPTERRLVRKYCARDGGRILDVGCGVGRTTGELNEIGFDVVGIDISEPMIHRAAERFPITEFLIGDASDLPFADASFRYVFFPWNGLGELPKGPRNDTLREIRRVLRSDGTFIFSNYNTVCYYLLRGLYYPRKQLKFSIRNVRRGRTLSRYKFRERSLYPGDEWIGENYFIDPINQKCQLRSHGFEPIEVAADGVLPPFAHPSPHYVARKVSVA